MALKGHEKAHALQETRQKKKKKKSQSESWNVSKKPVGFKEQLERKKPKRVMERVEEASRIHGVLRYFSHLKAYVSIRQHTSAYVSGRQHTSEREAPLRRC